MTTSFGWKRTLLYSLLPMVAVLASLEAVARIVEIWAPPCVVDFGLGFTPDSRLFVPDNTEPGVMATNPRKLGWCFNKHTFAMPKPAGTFRIFAIGGSNVYSLEGFLPEYEASLAAAVGNQYEFEVINAGGVSYGSHRLVPVAAEIMAYEPDLVMLYTGHNEFEELEQLELADLETLWLQRLVSKSALCRFVRDLLGSLEINKLETEHNKRILARNDLSFVVGGEMLGQICALTPDQVRQRVDAFHNNLSSIVNLCQANNTPIIMGTVPANYFKCGICSGAWERYQPVLELFEHEQFEKAMALAQEILRSVPHHQATDDENDAILAVAKEFNVPVADVRAAITAAEPNHVPGETLFVDHCHLSAEGYEILLDVYKEQILSLLHTADS